MVGEDELHYEGVACDLFFVPALEGLGFESPQQLCNFGIREFRPLDPRRGTHTLDGRNPAELTEPFRRKPLNRTPVSLVAIDLADEVQHFAGDREIDGQFSGHGRENTRLRSYLHPFISDYSDLSPFTPDSTRFYPFSPDSGRVPLDSDFPTLRAA